jgi:hypothetical protein
MLEREKYHEALREEALQASEDDGGEQLEIIDNEDDDEDEDEEGKANAVPDVPPPSSTAAGKRRRAPIDPFAGMCGSPQLTFFHLPQLSFPQASAIVQIPARRQRPLRLILHRVRCGLAPRFDEFIKRTSVLRPRVAPKHLQAEGTRMK